MSDSITHPNLKRIGQTGQTHHEYKRNVYLHFEITSHKLHKSVNKQSLTKEKYCLP